LVAQGTEAPGAPGGGSGRAAPAADDGDFAALYLHHYSRLVRALMIAGADLPTAQDLAQEAFARAFRRWRHVRAGANPPGYLHTVAFRLLRRRHPLDEAPLDDDLHPSTPGVEEAAVDAETVRLALAAMPPRQRACVALCVYLGYTTEETAGLLGISPSTVRVQLYRARQRLRTTAAAPAIGDKLANSEPAPAASGPRHHDSRT
jgi:RNA polymerase sigma-70 factor (ECF subfamily)